VVVVVSRPPQWPQNRLMADTSRYRAMGTSCPARRCSPRRSDRPRGGRLLGFQNSRGPPPIQNSVTTR